MATPSNLTVNFPADTNVGFFMGIKSKLGFSMGIKSKPDPHRPYHMYMTEKGTWRYLGNDTGWYTIERDVTISAGDLWTSEYARHDPRHTWLKS